MKMIPLKSEARDGKVAVNPLRRSGKVPCVLYGNAFANMTISCDHSELFRVYTKAGESVLVEIDVAGKKVPALFHDVAFAPVRNEIIHVDFYVVDMNKEIEANVPIVFLGIAPAVRDSGAVLVTVLDHLTIKCLPGDLPQHLEASIESLMEFNDAIHVSDVKIPAKVKAMEDAASVVATVQEPRREVVEEVVPAEGELAPGATAEGAVPAEGAAAAAAAPEAGKKEKKDKKE